MSAGRSIRRVPVGGGRPGTANSEAGFTLVEVLVAMMISIIVIGAMVTTFVKNADSSLAGQRQAQLYGVAQQQIENIRGIVSRYGFTALALTGPPNAPSHLGPPAPATYPYDLSVNPYDPNDFIQHYSATPSTPPPSFLIETNYNNTSETNPNDPTSHEIAGVPAGGEPLEINGINPSSQASGRVVPEVTGVPVGGGTATVYTYVTQASVPCIVVSPQPACALDDARRVIVAVRLDNPAGSGSIGPRSPVYSTTVFSNPSPSNQPNVARGLRVGLNIG